MNSEQIRNVFLDFFSAKGHQVVPSAPMVVKNDPTLMFTNAGMNQFKDVFLGNMQATHSRVANTQKCLRVSGKHNDLEEVGHDTYHHTMFEMLGNWSFGDYFKQEAIAWAWELLTKVYKLEPDRLYVTVFEGDSSEGLHPDEEARTIWRQFVPEERILFGSKKDNFWEMGDTGPCGPCSEIHIDLRDEASRKERGGHELVNRDNPLVVEIWNLVFIEYNRQANGQLQELPQRHVDTGMGFERLCMAIQGKYSNYDTDVFQPTIQKIAELTSLEYGIDNATDVAMRVVADHLRAVAFAIADGELPSNNKAGYVIRRILRRAIRYAYNFLNVREPFICRLIPVVVSQMGKAFPELVAQQELITRVIEEEEHTFLRTLSAGIQKFEHYLLSNPSLQTIDGHFAFELFDTYGFPVDLTMLMARERGLDVDLKGFEQGMEAQKTRSRAAASREAVDWVVLKPWQEETRFLGYESLEAPVSVIKYRGVNEKGKNRYHVVLDQTPFYAESGGQVGDRGLLVAGNKGYKVVDTIKENNLVIHVMEEIPENWPETLLARVDKRKRLLTANNHTATHLLHAALREVLGGHVQQKGSLVDEQRLRFDFSHFSKLSAGEIAAIEKRINEKIRENIPMEEHRDLPVDEAMGMGALALFGEKYGEKVRVVAFDKAFSTELCGGTHVSLTGQIGLCKIISEGAIAAGIRRVEAVTGYIAEDFVNGRIEELESIRALLKHPKDSIKAIRQILDEQDLLRKDLQALEQSNVKQLADTLVLTHESVEGVNYIGARLSMNPKLVKDLAFAVKAQINDLFLVIAHEHDGKPGITVMLSESLVRSREWHAGHMVRALAAHISGGGGGQPFFATAGGKDIGGLDKALQESRKFLQNITPL